MRRRSYLLASLSLGLTASCAVVFPDYPLGSGGTSTTDTSSASNAPSSSSGSDTSSSSGCGDTSMSTTNCGTCGHACGTKNTTSAACDAGKCVLACTPSFTQCPSSESDGCTNLLTSSTNCGKCGHDCGGGACTMGVCQAQVIVMGQGTPTAITTDKDRIYWINSDTKDFHVVPKSTVGLTMPTAIMPNAPATPVGLATDGHTGLFGGTATDASTIYFSPGPQGVYTMSADGTGTSHRIGDGGTGVIVSSGPYFFWLFGGLGGSVVRFDTSSNSQSVFGNGDTYSSISDVTADATNVYWADYGLGGIFSTPVAGMPCNEASAPLCSQLVSASGAPTPYALAHDDNNVYWAEGSAPGGIFKVSKTTKMITKLANAGTMIFNIATDGTNIYWIDGDWLFYTSVNAPTACAGTGPLCGYLDSPSMGSGYQLAGLWVDADAVYWTHKLGPSQGANSGTISRLVK